jgi:hypothetical protein
MICLEKAGSFTIKFYCCFLHRPAISFPVFNDMQFCSSLICIAMQSLLKWSLFKLVILTTDSSLDVSNALAYSSKLQLVKSFMVRV